MKIEQESPRRITIEIPEGFEFHRGKSSNMNLNIKLLNGDFFTSSSFGILIEGEKNEDT